MALSTQRALPCLPWAESAPRWKYDVFLSFRGEDIRRGFISHLYDELQHWQAIKTFKDDPELEKGATISPELLSAIEQSHLAIVVLSPNYASSTWCLDELAKIVESMETRNNAILPVFLNVDPSDVRHQRSSFAEAFAKHDERFNHDLEKVERWRAALTKVTNLSGWDSKNYESERELINAIVKYVWDKVHPTITLLHSTDKLVGIDLGELYLLLDLEAKDVRFMGIWGMGGVGKTTLAQLVLERISHQFEVSKFLGVRDGTLVNLQKQLLSSILKENIGLVWNEKDGTSFIQRCLFNKKVILVVDDVENYNQLELLVGNKSWFGEGSRIIVTTRDKRLLIEHDIESFEVAKLNYSNSIELFSQNAFKKDEPEEGFSELSQCFVDYCKGLPLALKILGRSLYKRNLAAWNSALEKLKKIPNPTIIEKLKLSYDALDPMQKEVFLDVAFFNKLDIEEERRVIEMLDSCGFSGRIEIDVLVEKSLLYHRQVDNIVGIHGLVQEMAWDIVRQESNGVIGRRIHLFRRDDIDHVFMQNTGTESIKGICLCLPKLEEANSNWSCKVFSKMLNLRFLKFDNLIIHSVPKFLPNSLMILTWNWYPSKFLPASFQPNSLAKLEMRNSKLVRLWDGKQDLPNLRTVDLRHSKNLIKIPDFTGIPNLEKLDLAFCTDLVEIDPSIATNKKLRLLILKGCDSIERFPSMIEMDSLEILNLSGCSKVKLPEFGEGMKNLCKLYVGETTIKELFSTIEHLNGIIDLVLNGTSSKYLLANAFLKLASHTELDIDGCFDKIKKNNLSGCSKLEKLVENTGERHEGLIGRAWPFPRALRSLQTLVLINCNVCEGAIPDDIGYCFPFLTALELHGNNFFSLPASIKYLSLLWFLDLSSCKNLQQLPDLPSNRDLSVWAHDCDSLKMLSEPSQQGRSTNLEYFYLTAVNCSRLADEEALNNGIFSMLRRLAAQGISPKLSFNIVSCGSKISEWFNIQSDGHSLTVELPPPDWKNSELTGIMFCVVFAVQKNNSTLLERSFYSSIITCFSQGIDRHYVLVRKLSDVKGDHVWVFYMSHSKIQETTNYRISFSFHTCSSKQCQGSNMLCSCLNSVKRCGARLLYEEDLKQLLNETMNQRTQRVYKRRNNLAMNICKRRRKFCGVIEEEGPSANNHFPKDSRHEC